MHKHGSTVSMVTISWPALRESSSSRYRLGIARRPFASRLIAFAPRNTGALSEYYLFALKKPTSRHFPPLAHTIGMRPPHRQGDFLRKTLTGRRFRRGN